MDALIRGEIIQIIPSAESALYVTVVVKFSNDSLGVANIRQYRIQWPRGRIHAEPEDFFIRPQSSKERSLRISPKDGDLAALLDMPAAADVEIVQVDIT